MELYQDLLGLRNQTLINAAFQFFYQKLDISPAEQALINIRTVKRIPDADGVCQGIYKNGELVRIDIRLKSYSSPFGMLDSLAHELVHAKQHLRGDFSWQIIYEPFLFFFKSPRMIRLFKGERDDNVPYYDQKCEQEAFNTSHKLMLEFCHYIQETQNTSTESTSS